jgi:hypothetical protein
MARLKLYSPFAARSVCRARTNGVTNMSADLNIVRAMG